MVHVVWIHFREWESFLETKFNHHSDYSNEKPTRHNPDPDVRVLSTGSLSCRRSPAKVFTLFKVSSLNLKQLKLARLVTLIIRLGQYKWTNSPRSRSKSAENWVNEINCFSWTLTPRSNHGPNIFLVYGCDGGCREIFETLKDSFYFTWGQDFCDYRNLTFSDDFHAANNHSDHPMFETFIDEGQFWLKRPLVWSATNQFDLRKVILSKSRVKMIFEIMVESLKGLNQR